MVNIEDFTPNFDTKDIIIIILCISLICTCIGNKIGRNPKVGEHQQPVIEIVPNPVRTAYV